MATQQAVKTRIREPMEPTGVIGRNAAAKKYQRYGIAGSHISTWVKNGEVAVAREAAGSGQPMLLDEASLRRRLASYTPHRDNSTKKTRARSKTIPEIQAEQAAAQAAQPPVIHPPDSNGTGAAPRPAPAARTTPARPALSGPAAILDTREWLERYYQAKAQRTGGTMLASTRKSKDYVFVPFAKRFPALPLERSVLVGYIYGLKDRRTGQPVAQGTKQLAHREITALYNWLDREHGEALGIRFPHLRGMEIRDLRPNAVAFGPDQVRQILRRCRNPEERTIILLLAQTGCRISELCSIRPENIHPCGAHGGYAEIWGKVTSGAPTGYRPLPILDEAWDALQVQINFRRKFVWRDGHGIDKELAGPIVKEEHVRAIDRGNPQTYHVYPRDGIVNCLEGMIRKHAKKAGVWVPGGNAHAFRRGYEAAVIRNGMPTPVMRAIMGHYNAANMDDRYFFADPEELVEMARGRTPRAFLEDPRTLEVAADD